MRLLTGDSTVIISRHVGQYAYRCGQGVALGWTSLEGPGARSMNSGSQPMRTRQVPRYVHYTTVHTYYCNAQRSQDPTGPRTQDPGEGSRLSRPRNL